MADKEFTDKSITLSFEFDRYLTGHPEFTKKEKYLAQTLKSKGESFVIVRAKKLLPIFETRLVNPRLELEASI